MAAKKSTNSSKKVAKKASKKKTVKRVTKKKAFEEIPKEQYFILANGREVNHYVSLAHILEELEEDIIKHHVSEMRHDFANWINDVFSEEELAQKIRVTHKPDKMRLIIYRHIIDKHLK